MQPGGPRGRLRRRRRFLLAVELRSRITSRPAGCRTGFRRSSRGSIATAAAAAAAVLLPSGSSSERRCDVEFKQCSRREGGGATVRGSARPSRGIFLGCGRGSTYPFYSHWRGVRTSSAPAGLGERSLRWRGLMDPPRLEPRNIGGLRFRWNRAKERRAGVGGRGREKGAMTPLDRPEQAPKADHWFRSRSEIVCTRKGSDLSPPAKDVPVSAVLLFVVRLVPRDMQAPAENCHVLSTKEPNACGLRVTAPGATLSCRPRGPGGKQVPWLDRRPPSRSASPEAPWPSGIFGRASCA